MDIIYRTLKATGLKHDEGPDKDGGVGPYVQSERQATGMYLKYAKQLIEQGDAYYCFCGKEELESMKTNCRKTVNRFAWSNTEEIMRHVYERMSASESTYLHD